MFFSSLTCHLSIHLYVFHTFTPFNIDIIFTETTETIIITIIHKSQIGGLTGFFFSIFKLNSLATKHLFKLYNKLMVLVLITLRSCNLYKKVLHQQFLQILPKMELLWKNQPLKRRLTVIRPTNSVHYRIY